MFAIFAFYSPIGKREVTARRYTCAMPDTNSVPENLDAVLRKYGKIWIWSILSAAVAALSVRFMNNAGFLTFQTFQGVIGYPVGGPRNSPWAPLVMLWTFIPSLGPLAAVYFLLQFLRHHLLPILFPAPPAPPAPDPESENFALTGAPAENIAPALVVKPIPDGAQLLFNAFAAILIAMALEAVGVLVLIVYRAVV
jgi:hypothetical protein